MASGAGQSLSYRLPSGLLELQDRAREVAKSGADRSVFPEDGWLVGYDRAFTRELGAHGWLGMTWPREAGGHARSPLERFVVYEQLVACGAPVAAGWFADRQIGPTLLQFGTVEQRRRWLPDIVAGTSMWCIGMSEPDAGSDLAAIRTTARRHRRGWSLNGRKVWTSGAADADWCYCVARTDLEAPPHEGLSEFVVDMRAPGVEVRRIRDMTSGQHFCEVTLDGVIVEDANLVGALNGSFRQLMRQLEHERGGIDRLLSNWALWLDLRASGLLDEASPSVRQSIAHVETKYRIGRLLVLREVMQQAPRGWSSITKVFGTEFEVALANLVAQTVGAGATAWESQNSMAFRASRAACYAPAYTIMGGTVSILRNILAERVLGLPR